MLLVFGSQCKILLFLSTGEDTGKLPECDSFLLTSGNLFYKHMMVIIIVCNVNRAYFSLYYFELSCIYMLDLFLKSEDIV